MEETIKELAVSVTVLQLLAIWPDPQTRVLAAYVDKSFYYRHYTTAVIVRHAIQNIHFCLAQDQFDNGFIYVLCPTAEDVRCLHRTTWQWMDERVIFRAMEKFTMLSNEVPPFGEVIEEGVV